MNQNSSMESSGELSALFTRSEIHPVVDGVCVIFLFLETPIEKQRLDKAVQFKKHIDWICSLKHINELPPNIVRLSADGFQDNRGKQANAASRNRESNQMKVEAKAKHSTQYSSNGLRAGNLRLSESITCLHILKALWVFCTAQTETPRNSGLDLSLELDFHYNSGSCFLIIP